MSYRNDVRQMHLLRTLEPSHITDIEIYCIDIVKDKIVHITSP